MSHAPFRSSRVARFANRRGFSAFELLVVIAIIAILIALLLPAIQQAREAARRSQCQNKVRQILIAAHNFADARQHLPEGSATAEGADSKALGLSLHAQLLPYLEESATFGLIDFKKPADDLANQEVAKRGLKAFHCDSDMFTGAPANEPGRNNYFGCLGAGPTIAGDEKTVGIFAKGRKTRFSDIKDGVSSTILIFESTVGATGNDSSNTMYQVVKKLSDDDGEGKHDRGHRWLEGSVMQSIGLVSGAPSPVGKEPPATFDKLTVAGDEGAGFARSYHRGGANIGSADGSVTFWSMTMDPGLVKSKAAIADGM
jgi:prepilin-type N-terminal cleavage/methylation domain-containing protein